MIIFALIALLLIILAFVAGVFMYNLALNPKSDRSVVFSADHNTINVSGDWSARRAQIDAWWARHQPQSRYIQAEGGLGLHAFEARNPAGGGRWAIICHGYTGTAAQMGGTAMMFWQAGYSVLIPDCRGHGKSQGHYIGMGWHDRLDIARWAHTLAAENPGSPIALFGVSMGGAAVMMAAGEALPPEVFSIVEDCGYTSVWDEFAYQLRALFGLPPFPVLHAASIVCRVRAGYWLGRASAVRQLKKAAAPMLFIHGQKDTFVPAHMLDQAYNACAAPKERLLVPGAGHGLSANVLGDEYWRVLLDFLDRHAPPGQ